ncbi:HAMP domain-containing histidine kinase [Ancylomarina sp. DW003]|nr:HAMP domain-containing sensor histidine kinase [Ancylomarina sp. DW003]MDE5420657.1 HAMP domain-containing histidine kinase [Ancylomarina sp. DW003]
MRNKLLNRLSIIAVLVLAILIVSQGLWLWQQLEQEKQAFTSKLENSLQSVINFHALQGYRTPNPAKPDVAIFSMEKVTNNKVSRDTSAALGRFDISTKKYIPGFALGKLIEASFTDKSLLKDKFKLKTVDSLFINNFPDYTKIQAYRLQLFKNRKLIDSLSCKISNIKKTTNSPSIIHLQVPLGTKNIYTFIADFQMEILPFLRQMVFSIGISALAIILVAFFMLWLLSALQRQIAQLLWREQAVSGIVHDLKSPLSYVYTFLDYLASKEQQPIMQERLASASTNISKLTDKMEVLLTLFRSKKKKITMEPAPYNLAQKCRELLSELELIYQEKKPKYKLSIPDDLEIKVDVLYFEAALRNLLDNAFKYSNTPAKLAVTTSQKQKELYICIADSGKGIPQKELKKIFQEFYRTDDNRKGHGIGLAFSQKIIKAHKGRINLQSEIGKGSSFCIILPAQIIV